MTRVLRIFDWILDISLVLTCLLITFLMLSVSFEVLMRYFFGRPINWTVEFAGHILLYIPFLVGAWVLRREAHTKMDLLFHLLTPRQEALLGGVTSALGALTCFVIAWFAAKVTLNIFQNNVLTQTPLMLPQWPIMGIVPVGMFLLFIQFVRRVFNYLGLYRRKRGADSEERISTL